MSVREAENLSSGKRWVNAIPSVVMQRMTEELKEIIRADIRRMFSLHLERNVTDDEVNAIMNEALRQYQMSINGHRIKIDGRMFFVTIDPEKYMLHTYGETGRQKTRSYDSYGRRYSKPKPEAESDSDDE